MTTMLVVTAIAAGMFIGTVSDRASVHLEGWINTTVLALIILLVIDIRIVEIPRVPGVKTWFAVVLATNFLAIPLIGFTIASLGFPDNAAVATGLAIYFMAPCTDWFLGFTRLARGNVALGAALLPINLAIQLVLAPIYLALFAERINLGFYYGADLPDPAGLLEGSGALMRHIKITTAAQLATPAVHDLVAAAARHLPRLKG